jgi:hypothetical protein
MRDVWRYSVWCDAVFPSYMLLCRMQVQAGAGGASGSRGTINVSKPAFSIQLHEAISKTAHHRRRRAHRPRSPSVCPYQPSSGTRSRVRIPPCASFLQRCAGCTLSTRTCWSSTFCQSEVTEEMIRTTGSRGKEILLGTPNSLMQELHVQDVRLGGGQAFRPIRTPYPASIHPQILLIALSSPVNWDHILYALLLRTQLRLRRRRGRRRPLTSRSLSGTQDPLVHIDHVLVDQPGRSFP